MKLLQAFGQFAGQAAAEVAGPGWVLLTPTSVAYTGTSASIGVNGQVTFTAVSDVSVNGVFTSTYTNYAISIRHFRSSGSTGQAMTIRFRASGSDASGSDYTAQQLDADASSLTGVRDTSQTSGRIGASTSEGADGNIMQIFQPALAVPTVYSAQSFYGRSNARIIDYAGSHNVSSAYDGFTLLTTEMTGTLQVYGVVS